MFLEVQSAMDCLGKSIVQTILDDIQDEIQEYYGQLNELKMGATSKPPEKPAILSLNDQLKLFNLPLWAGGLMDQPWLMMEILTVARQTIEMMEYLQHATQNPAS